MNLLAVDPGKLTGLAWLHDGAFGSTETDDLFEWWQLSGGGWDAVACESYVVTAATLRKTRQNWSLELIGALRWETRRLGQEFHLQTPADAKSFATDEKLRRLGWYTPTKGGHANDAARHLLLRGVRAGVVDVARLV